MSAEIFMCAGEASGDMHGAELLAALHEQAPGLRAFGVSGPRMESAGCERLVSMNQLGQAGLIEVLRHLPHLYATMNRLEREAVRRRPAACVLVDFPDFNLRLARRLKRAGLRVVYHVSPQLWAWRKGRVRIVREVVDRMLVLFPFEEEFYRRAGVPVTFVGHPIVDAMAAHPSAATRQPLVALMPGSRAGEVAALLPAFVDAARLLAARRPDLRFLLIRSPTLSEDAYRVATDAGLALESVPPERRFDRLAVARGAFVASGTATLELALLGVPMVIGYRLHPLSYWLARALVDVPSIGLVNLVGGRRIVPERVQTELTAEHLVADLLPLIDDGAERTAALTGLSAASAALGPPGAGARAAAAILAEMESAP